MSRNAKVEGTKIAQAAKDLNVTSVTIRRYITEFNIETTSDENGIKVLPDMAMEELQKIRELKEEGLTNPQVLEKLEEMRSSDRKPAKAKAKAKAPAKAKPEPEIEEEEEEKPAARVKEKEKETKRPVKRVTKVKEAPPEDKDEEEEASEEEKGDAEGDADGSQGEGESGEGKPKHSLTCQTCGKVFEHMNPRLRDCLDCYRAKRKERRRGGAERHKNVIQHPLAQQAASRQAQQTTANGAAEPERFTEEAPKRAPQRDRDRDRDRGDRDRGDRTERETAATVSQAYIAPPAAQSQVVAQGLQRTVRNYRKAIEETRNITGSLKRRLERPDLPEGERRWLEQIYAYQLILHQGWRHLAEYKAATQQQGKGPGSSSPSPLAIDD